MIRRILLAAALVCLLSVAISAFGTSLSFVLAVSIASLVIIFGAVVCILREIVEVLEDILKELKKMSA